MSKYEDLKATFIKEGKEEYFNTVIEETCSQVERQTDYSREDALDKLIEHKLNTTNVIKEWLGLPLIKSTIQNASYRSPNQRIYDEFRSFLDDAAKKYYDNKK
jgi:hypothetical protein